MVPDTNVVELSSIATADMGYVCAYDCICNAGGIADNGVAFIVLL